MRNCAGNICALALAALLSGCGIHQEDAVRETGWMSEIPSVTVWDTASSLSSDEESGSLADGPGPDFATGSGEEAPEPEISLVMVGDILLHTPVAESGYSKEGYDFGAVFAHVEEEIRAADLALVNQEVILGGAELGISGYPAFNAPYELGDALAEAGFDVVLHATNHALDKGKRGVQNCISFWQENHPEIAVLGIHESEDSQREIYVYEQEGIRVAILNYTYGTNGISLPGDMPYAVDLLERDRVEADLQRARELADFVIVCPHWGTEYLLEADGEQKEWADFFAGNGADLVLGTHPHVIEPVVWAGEEDGTAGGDAAADSAGYRDEAGGGTEQAGGAERSGAADGNVAQSGTGRALVYYSLGNFVNWTSGTGSGVADRMVGGMAQVVIGLDEDGQVYIKSYGVEPLVCHVERGFGGVTVYPLEDYTEELAARNEIVEQDGSFSLEYCRRLAEEVFGTLAEKEED